MTDIGLVSLDRPDGLHSVPTLNLGELLKVDGLEINIPAVVDLQDLEVRSVDLESIDHILERGRTLFVGVEVIRAVAHRVPQRFQLLASLDNILKIATSKHAFEQVQ